MPSTNAAEDLEGEVLPGDWTVVGRIRPRQGDTGGNFSVNYWVEHSSGRRGFCKVLNYDWLINTGVPGRDPVEALATATRIYQFERDLARECVGLSRVVTALHDGSFHRDGYSIALVSYIIFEVAEGDIRRVLNQSVRMDAAVRLRTVHQLATGLRQLHQRRVAHQDVKPSNTLVFPPDGNGARVAKVADLGRATVDGRPMDHDDYTIAGDRSYAPPEGAYDAVPDGFGPRRLACDMYQLGSMLCFVFTASSFNAFLFRELHPRQHPVNWRGSFDEVLPYLEDAYGRAIVAIGHDVPEALRPRVERLLRQLCHPDPHRRGHPKARRGVGNPYALDRIVSELDLLAHHAELRFGAA